VAAGGEPRVRPAGDANSQPLDPTEASPLLAGTLLVGGWGAAGSAEDVRFERAAKGPVARGVLPPL
jgi:hypothetical protein